MKLQNLIIIFIIIIIPIVMIFSLYLNLETKTIVLQTDYDEKLIEATKEAVEAFEINTVEWNSEYSTLANAKRQDVMSSINVFATSLSDKLRIGGSSKETIFTYVPAIIFTMYDGYFIYTPTYVPKTITNNNGVQLFYYKDSQSEEAKYTSSATQNVGGTIVVGEPMYSFGGEGTATGTYGGKAFTTKIEDADKTYKHVLKTFVPYTTQKNIDGKKYVINYTLDDYVRIYGAQEGNADEKMEGYIMSDYNEIKPTQNSLSVRYNNQTIEPENLTENIAVRDNTQQSVEITSYPYIYNSSNDKRYYDIDKGKFFTVNKKYEKVYLPETDIGTNLAEYKKILICTNTATGEYLELYQLLNGNNQNWFYIDETSNEYKVTSLPISISREKDCSAINYYIENYHFNKWLHSDLNLNDEKIQTILSEKNNAIITNINTNLNLSLSNYSANSGIDYTLPELSDTDWEQALSNISMITFFQGKKIGLKTYNNYVVVTSTQNNEYVNDETLYYINNNDQYYHRHACKYIKDETIDGIYKNTEFNAKNYEYEIDGDNSEYSKYYYKHSKGTQGSIQACFECIVNRNKLKNNTGIYEKEYYTALARERYIQMQRTQLTKNNQIIITNSDVPTEPVETTKPTVAIYDISGNFDTKEYLILAHENQKNTSKRIVCEDDSGIASVEYVVNQSLEVTESEWKTIENNSTIADTFKAAIQVIFKVGTNYIHVKATDINGNATTFVEDYIVKKDATLPTINIYDVGVKTDVTTYTISATETNITTNKQIVCYDESGITSIQYAVNQTAGTPTSGWNSITNNSTISVTFNVGTNYIHVKAVDANGNVNTLNKKYTINKDATLPTINIYDVGVKTDVTTYTISATETNKTTNKQIVCYDESGITSIQYAVNQSSGTPTTGWNAISNNSTIPVTLKVGTNYIHVKAVDANGNISILNKKYDVVQLQPQPEPLKVTFKKDVTDEWFGMKKNVKITFTITGGSGTYSVSENGTNKTISGNTYTYETTVSSMWWGTSWPSVTFVFKDSGGQTVTLKFQNGNVTT